MKVRKRPVELEAIQFTGNGAEVRDWVNARADFSQYPATLIVDGRRVDDWQTWFITKSMTASSGGQAWRYISEGKNWSSEIVAAVYDHLHETWVGVKKGQFILRGTKGEFWPIDPEVFTDSYDILDETPVHAVNRSKGRVTLHVDDEERQSCPACGRRVSCYVPSGGDGSLVRTRKHKVLSPSGVVVGVWCKGGDLT